MKRKTVVVSLLLGVLALFPALASAPQELTKPEIGKLKELADARAKVCERMLDYYQESLKGPPAPNEQGVSTPMRYAAGYEPIQLWSKRLVDARLDGAADLDGRIKVLSEELERIKKFEGELRALAKSQPEWGIVADNAGFYRLDAEYRLTKEKASR